MKRIVDVGNDLLLGVRSLRRYSAHLMSLDY
jgi:hypothetical protein